jgi:hypothetical protein
MNARLWYFDTGVFVTPILKNRPQAIVDACLAWRWHDGGRSGDLLTWDEVAPSPAVFLPSTARASEAGRLLRLSVAALRRD